MNHATPTFAAPGVQPRALHAFGGIWRLTLGRALTPGTLLFTGGLAVALGLLLALSVHHGDARNYFDWTVDFYLTVVIPALAFLAGAGLVRDDMKPIAVDYCFTRPVRRRFFLGARFVCHLACVQVLYLAPFAAVAGAGVFRHVPDLAPALPLLLLAQVLAVTAFTALGFLFGALTARYLVLGVLYAGIVELGLGNIPIRLGELSVLRHIKALLADLHFDLQLAMTAETPLTVTALLLGFTVVALALATLLFSSRELAGAKPSEG